MKNNKYTEKIKSIRAPQQSVDKAVEAALEAEKNSSVTEQKAPEKRIRLSAVLSAAAALVIIAGSIAAAFAVREQSSTQTAESKASEHQSSAEPEQNNTFSLMVNAAELTENTPVNYVDLDYSDINKMTAASTTYTLNEKNNTLNVEFYPELPFHLTCTGNNIKNVTYSINNAAFDLSFILNDHDDILNGENERSIEDLISLGVIELGESADIYDNDQIMDLYFGTKPLESHRKSLKRRYRKSFTINYDNEYKTTEEINSDLKAEKDLLNGLSLIDIQTRPPAFLLNSKDNKAREAAELLSGFKNMQEFEEFKAGKYRPDLRYAILNALISDISIDVTISYKDGQSDKCTIQLEMVADDNYSESNYDNSYHLLSCKVRAKLINK